MKIIKFFKDRYYRNIEMVKYWKTMEAVEAKVTKINGSYVMWMDGEKYPFPGFPRGRILFDTVSKLKHQIKNQIFNDSWYGLEDGMTEQEVIQQIKEKLKGIGEIAESIKLNMLPLERMCPMVQELWRAWTVAEKDLTGDRLELSRRIKMAMCFIMQEDDAYRFRVQWCMKFMPRWFMRNPVRYFGHALFMLEHAEVVGDMKERIRLLRRILLLVLKDKSIKNAFEKMFYEIDIKKIRLSKADKYFFRGKYFKVDYPAYKY